MIRLTIKGKPERHIFLAPDKITSVMPWNDATEVTYLNGGEDATKVTESAEQVALLMYVEKQTTQAVYHYIDANGAAVARAVKRSSVNGLTI